MQTPVSFFALSCIEIIFFEISVGTEEATDKF